MTKAPQDHVRERNLLAVLGEPPEGLQAPPDWHVVANPSADAPALRSQPAGRRALLLAPGASADAAAALLDGPIGFAAPVLGAHENLRPRLDAEINALTSEALANALAEVAPILRALSQWPDARDALEPQALGALAYAQSRDCRIEPHWAPEHRQAMRYPALFGAPSARRLLDELAVDGLLERAHAQRLHRCSQCDSSRLNPAEHCPHCAATFLYDERLIHHYACGMQGPQRDFGERGAMRCPKCGKRPRHFGVDYDSPGVIPVCGICGEQADPPDIAFTCMDCGRKTPTDGAQTVDWFAYSVTEEGLAALRAGRRPHLKVEDAFEPIAQSRSVNEFNQLLLHDIDIAARYDRPIAFTRAKLNSADELIRQHGREQVAEAFRLLAELTGEALRESDLLSVSEDAVLIAMPETTSENARRVLNRLNDQVLDKINIDLSFSTSVMDQEGAEAFLAERGLRLGRHAATGAGVEPAGGDA